MAVDDLKPDDVSRLIKLIGIVNKRTQNTILRVLENVNSDPSYILTPDDNKHLDSWYRKPEDTTDITIKCAQNMIFVVCKKLRIPD